MLAVKVIKPFIQTQGRINRWSKRALVAGKLAAVPSKIIENLARLDSVSHRVDRIEDDFKKFMASMVSKHLRPGVRICDIGCGPARFAQHIIPLMRQRGGGTYVGIDQSPVMIKVAEQVLRDTDLLGPDVQITVCSATEVSQLRKEFDLIINGQNLIHIVDDEELALAIHNQRTSLSPQGKVISYLPFTDENPAYHLVPRKNEDTYIRSEAELSFLFAEHGLKPSTQPGDRCIKEYFNEELYTYMTYQL